ncbi:MAG: hypothetical protein IKR78_00875 [Dehalococcoidales bacterium]|nr:hypothetical protein [Dehalococcoidales bacterium]
MEKKNPIEMDDEMLAAVAGGKLTKNAYKVMQMALDLARANNYSKEDVLNLLSTEWEKKNFLIKQVTTDFSQEDYDACVAFVNENM